MTKTARELGRQGSDRYIWHTCVDCGKERWVPYSVWEAKPKYKVCLRCSHIGKLNPHWKGGSYLSPDGYRFVLLFPDNPYWEMAIKNKGHILEHRLIMAQYLGRCLQPSEIVHHFNGIRSDNRIENLALISRKNHESYTFESLLQTRIRQLEQQIKELTNEK